MRTPAAVLSAAALGLALAACGGDDSADDEPTPDPTTPTSTPTAGGVASCVVGDWRSEDFDQELGGEAAGVNLTGGSGVALTVGPDGAANLELSGMEPISFTGEVAGADLSGELSYAGQASGTVRTDTGATSGTWEPVDEINWGGVRVTVNLTQPVEARPFDNVPIGDYADEADEWTGDVVDVDPVLGAGEFECGDGTLVLSPSDGAGMTWHFTST